MQFEVIDSPSEALVSWLEQKIDDYNWQQWEVKAASSSGRDGAG